MHDKSWKMFRVPRQRRWIRIGGHRMNATTLMSVLVACVLGGVTGVGWAVVPVPGDEAEMAEPSLQPEREQALIAYVLGRFNRVKQTLDADRAQARRYRSEEFQEQYEAEFNPSVALAQFKACRDCEEFSVRITRMQHSLHEDGFFASYPYASNVSQIEFITVPLKPEDSAPREMAVKLIWRPKSVREKGDSPLEITSEEWLERRKQIVM